MVVQLPEAKAPDHLKGSLGVGAVVEVPGAKGSDHLKGSLGVGAAVVASGGAGSFAMAAGKNQLGVPNAGELPVGLPVGGAGMAVSAAGGPSAVPWGRLKQKGDPCPEGLGAALAAGGSSAVPWGRLV